MNPLSHIGPGDPYPDSDGQPMADNSEQYQWLVRHMQFISGGYCKPLSLMPRPNSCST